MAETTQTWTLPSITREYATTQTAIALSLPSPKVDALAEVSRELLSLPLEVGPLELCKPLDLLDGVAVILERASGERLAVSLPEPLWHAALTALLGPAPRTHVPLEAERGALLYLAARLTHAALNDAFYVAGVTTTTSSLCAAIGVESSEQVAWCARSTVGVSDTVANAVLLCSTPLTESVQARNERLRTISFECAILCAETTLRTSELRTLSKGDVVLLDRFGVEQRENGLCGRVRLAPIAGADVYWECVMHDGELQLEAMKPDDPSPPAHTELQDLPIRLQVELARLSMSLGELESLRVGQVLRLAKSTGDVATLSANGHPVAYGEVVDIEGELGLRITRIESARQENRDAP